MSLLLVLLGTGLVQSIFPTWGRGAVCGGVKLSFASKRGAGWLPFEPFRTIKSLEGKNGSKKSKEVVWVYKNLSN